MKKYLEFFLYHTVLLGALYATGFIYPEYAWSIKTILYILICLTILIMIFVHKELTEKCLLDKECIKCTLSTPLTLLSYVGHLIYLIILQTQINCNLFFHFCFSLFCN